MRRLRLRAALALRLLLTAIDRAYVGRRLRTGMGAGIARVTLDPQTRV